MDPQNEFILDHIFRVEGGFVDHPDDRGGPTNMGISIYTLAVFRKKGVTRLDILNLTKAEATEVYIALFWKPSRLDLLTSPKTRLVIFDQCVNRGVKRAIIMAQDCVNARRDELQALRVDGNMGPNTAASINVIPEIEFCMDFIHEAEREYVRIVKNNPSQHVFLDGWLARAARLMQTIHAP